MFNIYSITVILLFTIVPYYIGNKINDSFESDASERYIIGYFMGLFIVWSIVLIIWLMYILVLETYNY